MNVQDITLDLSKEYVDSTVIRIGMGDMSGTTIRATVYDNGQIPSLTGFTAAMEMRLPDGTSYASGGQCSVSGNVITCVVDEEHFARVAGYTDEAYFTLTSGTTIYSTSRFRVKVERSASDGADPSEAWTNGIEEWLEDASDTLDDAVADANSRVGATINAANAAVEGMRSDVDDAIGDTEAVVERAEQAIDAMGDISELAVPVMSADIRGGARIQPDSGLEVEGTDNLQVRLALESDGTVRGGIAELTAKGHAEQFSTTGKNLWKPILGSSQGLTFTLDADGAIHVNGTSTSSYASNQASVASDILSELKGSTVSLSCPEATPEAYAQINCYYNNANHLTFLSDATTKTVTIPSQTEILYYAISVPTSGTTINKSFHVQLELGSTATEYEPYTGGAPSPSPEFPQTIEVVRGRNLLGLPNVASTTSGGKTFSIVNGLLSISGTSTGTGDLHVPLIDEANLKSGTTYTIAMDYPLTNILVYLHDKNKNTYPMYWTLGTVGTQVFTPSEDILLDEILVRVFYGNTTVGSTHIQLTLGSTPQPYVPYGHVGMEVQDPDTDELISCTALPLPQRGWVAGLPDGTADSLRLDGAGHVEWTLPTSERTFDGSSANGWMNNGSTGHSWRYVLLDAKNDGTDGAVTDNVLCDAYSAITYYATAITSGYVDHGVNIRNGAWLSFTDESFDSLSSFLTALAQNPVTVLYPLATPAIEDCGYCEDWPTDIPEGAVITIPELDEVGIKYFIDSAMTELARQWYARAYSEIGSAVVELAERVSQLENA